jgi:hypothetical protein
VDVRLLDDPVQLGGEIHVVQPFADIGQADVLALAVARRRRI